MARKKPHVDFDHQGSILSLVGPDLIAVPAESFPHDGPQDKILGRPTSYEVVYGPEGLYKDLAERAEELQAALGAFSMRNQRVGFAIGSNDHRHNGPIFGRYRAGVPRVQEGAERNASDLYLNQAKIKFWHGSGFEALRAHNTMNTYQLNARARAMWEKFFARFGTPVEDEDRENYERRDFHGRLQGVLEMTHAVKLKKANNTKAA